MNLWESIKVASKSIKGNKVRSILTALGIIFGVWAVIAMVSIGEGASKSVSDSIQSMGANMIVVSPNRGSAFTFEIDDAQEILERVPTISEAAPYVSFNNKVKWESESYDTSIEGVSASYADVRDLEVSSGRYFTEDEVDNRRMVAVIGETVIEELFNGGNPIGEKIMIKGQPMQIIGVLESKGSSMGRDSDDVIQIPITIAQRISGSKDVNTIYLKAKSADDASLAVAHVTAIFDSKYQREDQIRVFSQDEMLETVNQTTQTFTIMLAAIAGISLLVGGIGIMNIMLVSVTERTREIGIRKALGAKKKDILSQFLIESIFLSVSGGVIGIIMGVITSKLISTMAQWSTVISVTSILISFSFSLGVGLFFGVFPAYKAANLDPIEALRHE